jgi:hypothetical protein
VSVALPFQAQRISGWGCVLVHGTHVLSKSPSGAGLAPSFGGSRITAAWIEGDSSLTRRDGSEYPFAGIQEVPR